MLVVDPMKRVTIPEIRLHPWFQAHLLRYLAVPPPDTIQQAKKEVVKMRFDRNQLIESLLNGIENEDSGSNRMHPSEPVSPALGHRMTGYMDYQGLTQHGLRGQFPVERKWALRLQSRAHPREIMTEVLKALQELNVCWKKIGHYNMKCRWIPVSPCHLEGMVNNAVHSNYYFGDESSVIENDGIVESPNVVKFEVQLYKTRDEKYLLDLQRVQGLQFVFLDLYAALLAQLRVH